MTKLEKLLEDKNIYFAWTDERDRKRDWVGVGDVACSLRRSAVSVPRRKRDGHHFAEVLHEVAHLELWRSTGKSPTKQNDTDVCRLALSLAKEYGFSAYTIERLEDDLQRQLKEDGKPLPVPAQATMPRGRSPNASPTLSPESPLQAPGAAPQLLDVPALQARRRRGVGLEGTMSASETLRTIAHDAEDARREAQELIAQVDTAPPYGPRVSAVAYATALRKLVLALSQAIEWARESEAQRRRCEGGA